MNLPCEPVCRFSDKARHVPETVNERKPTSLPNKKWDSAVVFFWGAARQWMLWPAVPVHWCILVHVVRTMNFCRLHSKYYCWRSVYRAVELLLALNGSKPINAFLWSRPGLTLGHVMSKTKPKWCCKYCCGNEQHVSWAGVWCNLPLPTVVPDASATGPHPPSRSSAESKVPLLLPSTCFGSESLGVCTAPNSNTVWGCLRQLSFCRSIQ